LEEQDTTRRIFDVIMEGRQYKRKPRWRWEEGVTDVKLLRERKWRNETRTGTFGGGF
jgi:hypothetical protein